jgi:hypothetical protein
MRRGHTELASEPLTGFPVVGMESVQVHAVPDDRDTIGRDVSLLDHEIADAAADRDGGVRPISEQPVRQPLVRRDLQRRMLVDHIRDVQPPADQTAEIMGGKAMQVHNVRPLGAQQSGEREQVSGGMLAPSDPMCPDTPCLEIVRPWIRIANRAHAAVDILSGEMRNPIPEQNCNTIRGLAVHRQLVQDVQDPDHEVALTASEP